MAKSPSICNKKMVTFWGFPTCWDGHHLWKSNKFDHGTAKKGPASCEVGPPQHAGILSWSLKCRFLNIMGKPWKTPKATGANHQMFLIQWPHSWTNPNPWSLESDIVRCSARRYWAAVPKKSNGQLGGDEIGTMSGSMGKSRAARDLYGQSLYRSSDYFVH